MLVMSNSSFSDFALREGSASLGISSASACWGKETHLRPNQSVISPSLSTILNQLIPVSKVKPVQKKHKSNKIVPAVLKYGTRAELITSPTKPPAEKLYMSSKFILAMPVAPSAINKPPIIRKPIVR